MPTRSPRLRFNGIEQNKDEQNGQCNIIVQLSYEEKLIHGSSQGNISESNIMELTAVATLKAVESFVEHRFDCRLLDMDRVHVVGNDLIVLLINIKYDDRDLQIFGSCRATDDLLNISARAALDATNRFVELAMVEKDLINGSATETASRHDKPHN